MSAEMTPLSIPCLVVALGLFATESLAAPPGRALSPGPAQCQVNDGPRQPCSVRRFKPGSFDIETRGETPLLAYVESDAVYLFALYGPERIQIPLYGTYAIDPDDPACWQADDSDVAIRELCVRQAPLKRR